MQLKIVDIGRKFHMGVSRIFDPIDYKGFYPNTIKETEEVFDKEKPDLCLFGGGEDISPKLYGHQNVGSYSSESVIGIRDLYEKIVWDMCQERKIPILGICRGAQLACVLSGGSLIQNITGHIRGHYLQTEEGNKVVMNSVHHQMMHPFNTKHRMIAWCDPCISEYYEFDRSKFPKDIKFKIEPEIVLFENTNSLAVQGHPEFFTNPMDPPVEYVRSLVFKNLLKDKQP